jgi:FkbM family methyltransferase
MLIVELAKRLADRMPGSLQNELKRIHYRRLITQNRFASSEPEYVGLPDIIKPGDWVIDVGANVGHYTKRFSELVGANGRVFSFEPFPTTFALLAANVSLFRHANVTLFNVAVSNCTRQAGICVPSYPSGRKNYYQAHLSDGSKEVCIITLSLDSLDIPRPISLVKIDAEGHEDFVIKGMEKMLLRDHPVLIVETSSTEIVEHLGAKGYTFERLKGSPNIIFRHKGSVQS